MGYSAGYGWPICEDYIQSNVVTQLRLDATTGAVYILGQTGYIRGVRETRDEAKKLGERHLGSPISFRLI